MTMKILLAVDGSECSLRAVDHLLSHVSWFKEAPEIHLLHVHPPIPIGGVLAHVSKETLESCYRDEAESEMAEAKIRLYMAKCPYTPHIHVGLPAEVIVKQAAELGCDLIVLGTHGRGALAGLVSGSVATRVLHLASCPVLLVK